MKTCIQFSLKVLVNTGFVAQGCNHVDFISFHLGVSVDHCILHHRHPQMYLYEIPCGQSDKAKHQDMVRTWVNLLILPNIRMNSNETCLINCKGIYHISTAKAAIQLAMICTSHVTIINLSVNLPIKDK